ncbi:hypothetical protein KR093_004417, partial [Drosophila rubida]
NVDVLELVERMEHRIWLKMDRYEKDLQYLRDHITMLVKPRNRSFQKIGYKYYFIEDTTGVNWFEAHNRCMRLGAHLVSIQNKDEFELITPHLQKSYSYWTDINELSKDGEYVSSTAGQKPKFLSWHPNEPTGWEHCVEINYMYSEFGMNDNSCDQKVFFICE